MGFSITISHSLADFQALEKEWEDLQSRSDAEGASLSWTWVNVWLSHFLDLGELWLLTAREENDLVGIAPLFLRKVKADYGFPYRQMEFIGAAQHNENQGFIIKDGEKEALTPKFIELLLVHKKEWDAVLLTGIEDEETIEILENSGLNWERREKKEMISPRISLQPTVDEWFSSLSKNRRKKLRSYDKKLDVEYPGEWQIRTVCDQEDLDPIFDKLVIYHQRKWEEMGMGGAFNYGERVEYYRDLMWAFFAKGWLRLRCLTIKEEPIVILFTFNYRGRVFDHVSGALPMDTRIPLGYVITRFSVESAITEGMTEYSFMWGTQEYKYSFGAVDQTLYALELTVTPWVTLQKKSVNLLRRIKRSLVGPSKS